VTRQSSAGVRSIPEQWIVLGMWLLVSAALIWICRISIRDRDFPDPDDAMRLMQVRDWLGGQSWFDVSQYRLNAPAGVPMHWSRLVDLPIAAVILLFRPLVGQSSAETIALVTVPLITLGITMWLIHAIASRLMSARTALLAVVAVPFSLGALQQMRPMRIDHHGWQIVLALVGVLAALGERPRRSGLIAGAAMALWLNISIEGLPVAAAFGLLFGFNWLTDGASADRLKSYVAALASFSILLFGATHYPSTWMHQPHDVVTVAHLAGFVVAALGCALFVRKGADDFRRRSAVLVLIGGVSLAVMFAVDPNWLQGPFASVNPLVKRMWLDGVDEGQPLWKLEWRQSAVAVAQPIVGIAGALVAVHRSSGDGRRRALVYLYLLAAATLASVFVVRVAATASLISLPGTAFLCQLALARARSVSLMPVRVFATFGALCTIGPAYAVPLSVPRDEPAIGNAVSSFEQCRSGSEAAKLASLPPGTALAPLDITPDILVNTRHRGVASGHHRGSEAMADVIRMFLYPAGKSQQIIERRHVDYVVYCPGAAEVVRYAYHGKGGLSEMLAAGKAPAWLEPVRVPGLRALRVWRVRHG
jgi:hypothetical protein